MPTIRVEIPSRNQTIEFDEGTPESVIQEVIKREFPRNGQDVAYEVNQMPGFSKTISDEDFSLYEKFVDQKKTDLLQTAIGAAGGMVETVGKGIKGLFEIRNLSPEVAASTALESGLQGTRDLYGMVAQSEDPSSFFFKFKDLLDGTSSVEERKKQWLEARNFVEQTQKYEAGKETVSGLDPALVNNDVKNTLKLIADPTLFIPGVGELVGAGKFGTRATGLAMKGTGAAATAVTKPLSEFIGGVGRMAGEAIGADAGKLRNVAAGAGVTGFAMGIPGVTEAAAVVGAIEGANKAGQVLERAGGQLMNAPTRIGALESLALNPNASSFDRAIAKVGRYGGDDIIDMGSRALAGGVEGAAIGTVLGGLAGGEEGAAAGFGSGGVLGAGGAGIARVVDKASGKAAVEARHNDFNRFYENLDKDTQSKFDTVVQNSGIDGAAQVMDISGIIRGKFNDADVRFSNADEFATKYGQDARGVQIVEGERPVVDINVDKFNSQATVGHELFHAFKAIDQLRPLAERAEQMIVGNYIIDANGQSVRTSPGLLDDAAILKTFDEYVSKLKPDENSKWAKANTLVEKSKLIGEELGAEYMSRLIQGSDTDAMLRGFDGLTRTILDKALLSNTEGFLRRTAQSLGLGSKPIESLVFTKLEQASPALNAALRDMVRARRNMNKKIELAEDTGFAIRNRDLANPTDMGIAETGVDGVTRMKPDDVLAQEDRASSDALTAAIKSAPVVDVNEPRLREVDGQIVGDGISNAQLAAIQASPNIIDKVKKGIAILKDSIESGNVIFIRNGKATKEIKSRLTGKTLKRYNDGVRITERDIVPYALATSQAGELFVRTFDISKARNEAMSLASRDRLGPYQADFQTFYGDLARYLNNLSDRENAVPTKELFGDAAKAAYMTDFFGGKDGTSAKYIRNFTLDRMIDMRPTGEKVSMSQIAYDRNKARFMPAENLGESKVFTSPDSGFTIISKGNKHSLYDSTKKRIGIYDTQAGAEAKAAKVSAKISGPKGKDVFARSLEDIKLSIPANERWIGTKSPGQPVRAPDGRRFLEHDLNTKTGAMNVTQDALDKAWANAIEVTGPAASRALSELKAKGHTMKPPGEAHWKAAENLPNKDRLWYEISAEAMTESFPDFSRDELGKTMDVVAATSPLADPNYNGRLAIAILAEDFQKVPSVTPAVVQSSVKDALLGEFGKAEQRKVGSFGGTFRFLEGMSEDPPLTTNDRQVAASMGIPDSAFGTYPVLYELQSRFVNNLRDYINANGGMDSKFGPFQSHQLQALSWVQQRAEQRLQRRTNITEEEAFNGDAYASSFKLAADDLREAGINVPKDPATGLPKFTAEVLSNPRVQQILIPPGAEFLKSTIQTMEMNTKLRDAGKQFSDAFDESKKLGIPGNIKLAEQVLQRAAKSLSLRTSDDAGNKLPSPLSKLVSVFGLPNADISRIEFGRGTFQGDISPNIRIPMDSIPEKYREAFMAVLGKHFYQAAQAASKFTSVEPSKAKSYSIWMQHKATMDGLDNFAKALTDEGHEANISQRPNGVLIDVHPKFTDQGPVQINPNVLQTIAEDVLGKGNSSVIPREYESIYLEKQDYDSIILKATKDLLNEHAEQLSQTASINLRDAKTYLRGDQAIGEGSIPFNRRAEKIRDSYRKRINQLQSSQKELKSLFANFEKDTVLATSEMQKRIGVLKVKSDKGSAVSSTSPSVNFQPSEGLVTFEAPEKLPNGQAWSTDNNYRVIQKEGGKYRVYAPTGVMIGVADTLDKSKKLIEKRSR